jgi:hypothetical protein
VNCAVGRGSVLSACIFTKVSWDMILCEVDLRGDAMDERIDVGVGGRAIRWR